jgi:hypothetical protein
MKPIADKSLSDFFEFHRARVTDEDIRDMVPSDPGFPGYIRFLKEVRDTGLLPDLHSPDLWEVVCAPPIGLKATIPAPLVPRYQASMSRYRNFVGSIALGSIDTIGPHGEWSWYNPVCWLMEDADRHDRACLRFLRAALKVAGEKLAHTETLSEADPLFFTLGVFFANCWLKDHPAMSAAARRLIKEEGEFRAQWCRGGTGFLWDLQRISKDRLERLKKLASELENPRNDFDVECVLRALCS